MRPRSNLAGRGLQNGTGSLLPVCVALAGKPPVAPPVLPVLFAIVSACWMPGAIAGVKGGSAVEPADEPPVSFRHDVLPLLTKSGCNAGACHGSPSGKNGFRLSLRGYDPALDFATLTREVRARRVNPVRPEDSLMLLKATAQVPHEGGRRFSRDSTACKTLLRWIREGARDDVATAPPVERLEILPDRRVLDAPDDSQALMVVARFAGTTQRDVTHLCRFTLSDEHMASMSDSGLVQKRRRGEVSVSAEYCGLFATAQLVFREPVPEFRWPDPPIANEIDRHVFAKLKLLSIEPSDLTSDAEFARRVHLDVIGRLPRPDEVRTFLEDGRSDKRARLIDALLERPEFADWWALKWADRLGCNQRFVGKAGAIKYHAWIRHAMAVNMPEDEFVRSLLVASGPNYSQPAASFWRRLRTGGIGSQIDPLLAGEEISQLFLGVRIGCARCHNHPAERWTRDDYYGLAAFFARVRFKDGPFVNQQYDKENTVFLVPSAEVRHPDTGAQVAPRVLGREGDAPAEPVRRDPQSPVALDTESSTLDDASDRRVPFARWLTLPGNPWFARAAVNRIWFHLFGRGIVEPVDDLRSSNPPSNAELLEALTGEFAQSGFDRKRLIRTILNSRTYQLSSRPTPTNADDDRYFSHAGIRLMQSEQLLDAICDATGTPAGFAEFPSRTRAVQLPDGEYQHPFLKAFGRPARAMACECERENETTLEQALHLVSGRFVHARLTDDEGRAARLAAAGLANDEVVDELFLATLCRHPTDEERRIGREPLQSARNSRRAALEDLLWTLLNHEEFLFQH